MECGFVCTPSNNEYMCTLSSLRNASGMFWNAVQTGYCCDCRRKLLSERVSKQDIIELREMNDKIFPLSAGSRNDISY